MATIRGVIQIQDQMSPALRAMNNAMNMCISSFQSMQDVSSNAVDVSSLQAAQRELQNAEMAVNQVEENIDRAKNSQENFNNTVQNAHGPMDGLIGKVKTLVGAYLGMQATKEIINASDEIVQTKARLDLMNDGLQTTEQLQNMIFQSAQRSRGAYSNTASAVAKMGILAKDAFSSNEETVAFVEQLNKQFTICGTDIAGAQAATLQLTQALASGVLRGEELNSVFEQAPTVIQAIADYLDKPIGAIRDMASEGQITADVVKKAMFAAADETNKKFESMPKTIGQIWQGIKNEALMAFQPVLLKINEIANNPGFNTLVSNVSGACSTIAIILLNIINLVCSVAQFFSDNWGIIEPIVWGIVGALGAYLIVMGLVNLANLASAISTGAASLAADIYAASLDMQAGATFTATAAQYGLNAALLACPITWIVIAIIAIIAALYAVVGAINKAKGTSISATGIIAGVFWTLGATIWNIIAYTWNKFAAFAEFLANVFRNPVYSIKALFANLAINFLDICASMTSGIDSFATNFANAVIDGVNGAIKGLNWFIEKCNEVLGTDFGTFGTIEHTSSITSSIQGAKASIQDWLGDKPEDYIEITKMQMKDLDGAAIAGYNWGSNAVDKVKGMFSNDGTDAGSPFDYADLLANAEAMSPNIADTAKNTGAMKDALDIAEEDLKYMRDMAETEAINRFTTAEIKVDMTNHNTVNSDMDIDGIIDELGSRLEESLYEVAEGATYGV